MAESNQTRSARQAKIDAAAPKKSKATPIVAGIIVAAVLAAIVWAVVAGMNSGSNDAADGQSAVPSGAESEAGGIVVNADKVKPGAPRLDVYEDPQCPACEAGEQILGPGIAEVRESGEAQVVYHIKTFLDDNLRNDSSKRAGNAMMCAADLGKFQEYHDAVYAAENRPAQEGQGWTDVQLEQMAGQAGITGADLEQWKACESDDTYADYLAAVEERTARDDKVTGTPTYRIDGEDYPLTQQSTSEELVAAVRAKGGATPSASGTPSAPSASATPSASASN